MLPVESGEQLELKGLDLDACSHIAESHGPRRMLRECQWQAIELLDENGSQDEGIQTKALKLLSLDLC